MLIFVNYAMLRFIFVETVGDEGGFLLHYHVRVANVLLRSCISYCIVLKHTSSNRARAKKCILLEHGTKRLHWSNNLDYVSQSGLVTVRMAY